MTATPDTSTPPVDPAQLAVQRDYLIGFYVDQTTRTRGAGRSDAERDRIAADVRARLRSVLAGVQPDDIFVQLARGEA